MTGHLNRAAHNVIGTPGTGDLLLGSVPDGFLSALAAGAEDGQTYEFVVETSDGLVWEVGQYTYRTAGPTLERTTIRLTSNGGTGPLNLPENCVVYSTQSAESILHTAGSGFFAGDVMVRGEMHVRPADISNWSSGAQTAAAGYQYVQMLENGLFGAYHATLNAQYGNYFRFERNSDYSGSSFAQVLTFDVSTSVDIQFCWGTNLNIAFTGSAGSSSQAHATRSSVNNFGTGTIVQAVAFCAIAPTNSGGGTFTEYIDFHAPSGGGAIVTRYGVKVEHTGLNLFNGPVKMLTTTVASLPAAATHDGYRAMVTDANATTFASIVAGGGANKVPVYSDGTNWLIG